MAVFYLLATFLCMECNMSKLLQAMLNAYVSVYFQKGSPVLTQERRQLWFFTQ